MPGVLAAYFALHVLQSKRWIDVVFRVFVTGETDEDALGGFREARQRQQGNEAGDLPDLSHGDVLNARCALNPFPFDEQGGTRVAQ